MLRYLERETAVICSRKLFYNCIQFPSLATLLILLRRSRYFRRKRCSLIGLRQNQKRQKMLIFDTICTTLSSPLSVLFYQTTWSEFFQIVFIKGLGPSQKKWIELFYFNATTANFWALLNNLVWIFGKSLY